MSIEHGGRGRGMSIGAGGSREHRGLGGGMSIEHGGRGRGMSIGAGGVVSIWGEA